MSYESVDILQKALTKNVFNYAKSPKKAAGRALGTLVEIINFYLLKSWGYEDYTIVERSIPEYGNNNITHNVEFSLHPKEFVKNISLKTDNLPFTSKKIIKLIKNNEQLDNAKIKGTQLLSQSKLLRNACVIYEDDKKIFVASLKEKINSTWNIFIKKLYIQPFIIFECKRVGVEEGVKKGPQTIEKAKQGAYVARSVSSLQKIRMNDGSFCGVLQLPSGELKYEPYNKFLRNIIESNAPDLLRNFILTVGIVSNHGNWFTSEDHNKELKVLAQSYDWLLFLTDEGLSQFVENLLLNPITRYKSVREAFVNSYQPKKTNNSFTKVKISLSADKAIQEYFKENLSKIENWFNIISPISKNIQNLKSDINSLTQKKWEEVLT